MENVTKPTARVLRLLELLQSAALRTLDELAGQLDVDERTVRRYIAQLRDLDVPVESVRGRYGGYRIASGYRMPPLMLRDDEALAVLLGLLEMRTATSPLVDATAVETALSKIRRSLPATLDRRTAQLLELAVIESSGPHERTNPETLLTVADAVRHHRPLTITYRSRDNIVSTRTFHAYDLVAYGGRWYASGLDVDKRETRTLRLDRIRMARIVPGTFPERRSDHSANSATNSAENLVARFARAQYTYSVSLLVHATREHIAAVLPSSVAVLEDIDTVDGAPGSTRVLIQAESLDWLPRVILSLDCPVVIESPDELRDVVAQAAETLARIAAT